MEVDEEPQPVPVADPAPAPAAGPAPPAKEPRPESGDVKSVYIGNVDYAVTSVELQQHFADCGVVERVTIMTNKATGQPKGFAYMEFATAEQAKVALTKTGTLLHERELKVSLKRTNVPAFKRGLFRGRFRGRGRARGRFAPY